MFAALGVDQRFLVGDIGPVGMSCHSSTELGPHVKQSATAGPLYSDLFSLRYRGLRLVILWLVAFFLLVGVFVPGFVGRFVGLVTGFFFSGTCSRPCFLAAGAAASVLAPFVGFTSGLVGA